MKKQQSNSIHLKASKRQQRQSELTKSKQDQRHFQRNSKNYQIFPLRQSHPEYYPDSSRTSETICAMVQGDEITNMGQESQQTKITKDKTSTQSYFGTRIELEGEIQRLVAQAATREAAISELTQSNTYKKQELLQLTTQLNHTTREKQYMESHLKKYQASFLKMSRECDEKAKYKSQVEELVLLFEGMRKQNQQLFANLDDMKQLFNKMNQKYMKLKNRYQSQSEVERTCWEDNGSKSELLKSNSRTKIQNWMPDKQKKLDITKLQRRIEQIENKLKEINEENQQLFKQLDGKDEMIYQLKSQLKHFQSQSKEKQNIIYSLHKKYDSQKKLVSQTKTAGTCSTENQMTRQLKSSQNIYINKKLLLIMLKTKYNLLYSKVSYGQLIHNLANIQLNHELFMQFPYSIAADEYQDLVRWINQLRRLVGRTNNIDNQFEKIQVVKSILKQNVPCYHNVTFKKQYTLKQLIYHQYLNREGELNKKIREEQTIMNLKKIHEYFKGWGFTREQRDILMKSYYDLTNQLQNVNLQILKSIIIGWEKN